MTGITKRALIYSRMARKSSSNGSGWQEASHSAFDRIDLTCVAAASLCYAIHREFSDRKRIHLAFEIGLWLKGAFAITEIAGGTLALFITHQFFIEAANAVTQGGLAEDPHDPVANYFLHTTQALSIGTQHFTAFYLLSHGVIKLWLIVGLLRTRLWYYPTALSVFALFILYQAYRYNVTHSLVLIATTVVDVAVMALTWHEYRYLRSAVSNEKR